MLRCRYQPRVSKLFTEVEVVLRPLPRARRRGSERGKVGSSLYTGHHISAAATAAPDPGRVKTSFRERL
jgi:hypothetical protein